jgi:hypothetical protein
MRCPSCGHEGPLPDDVRAQLAAAARILRTVATSKMQLTARQQRALKSSWNQALAYWSITAIAGVPLLGCGLMGSVIALGRRDPSVTGALVVFSPLLCFALVATLGHLWVRSRYRSLRIACAALPPEAPGRPAGCHVCGAPLAAVAEAVVRCDHCAADNVLDPAALAEAAKRRSAAFAGFETVVQREATVAGTLAGQATVGMILAALVAPVFALVVFFGTTIVLWHIESPVDPAYRYGVVRTSDGDCVAHVYTRAEGKWLLGFGTHPPAGMKSIEERSSVKDLPAHTANDFVGRRVRAGKFNHPPAGVIARVHGSRFEGNEAVIAGRDSDLRGLCFDGAK